jgi:hypothetical protein
VENLLRIIEKRHGFRPRELVVQLETGFAMSTSRPVVQRQTERTDATGLHQRLFASIAALATVDAVLVSPVQIHILRYNISEMSIG